MILFFTDVELTTDYGFDANFVRRIHEIHCTENIAVVGHGDGGHAKLFDTLHELLHVAGAVEHRVVGVEVQVDELGHD